MISEYVSTPVLQAQRVVKRTKGVEMQLPETENNFKMGHSQN